MSKKNILTLSQQMLCVEQLRSMRDDITDGRHTIISIATELTAKVGFLVTQGNMPTLLTAAGITIGNPKKRDVETLFALVEELETTITDLQTRIGKLEAIPNLGHLL